jgi:DNA-binding transcriptional MerR regulator
VRIGELAGLVGISTRAIRHYHRIGLLAEPARRANGYREYSLRDAVEMARIRRLTELGLSLDEAGDALADDAGRDLAEILCELDADLARQEEDIRQRRARLARLLRQAETGGTLSGQAPVSPGLAALFDRMTGVAAAKPGPESAMAAKDREILALLETMPRGTGWLSELTRVLNSDPGAAEQAYAVYARLDELASLPVDDPRVEETARALVAAIPETARKAIPFPEGELEEVAGGFAAAFYADFAPAQAAAIRRAIGLMRKS